MTAGFFALAGALIGALAPLLTERFRAHREAEDQRREALRTASAAFTAALIRIRHLSSVLADGTEGDATRRIEVADEEAWIAFERIRMLSQSEATQKAGRFAVRHIYAVWQE